jgi:hypothetical protein
MGKRFIYKLSMKVGDDRKEYVANSVRELQKEIPITGWSVRRLALLDRKWCNLSKLMTLEKIPRPNSRNVTREISVGNGE